VDQGLFGGEEVAIIGWMGLESDLRGIDRALWAFVCLFVHLKTILVVYSVDTMTFLSMRMIMSLLYRSI
jgi:hypothetical protein